MRTTRSEPRPDTVNLRDRLLSEAEEFLRSAPLTAMSLRDLSRRAGVSHAAPYNHFADKEALVAALRERARSDLCRAMDEACAAAPEGAEDQLVAAAVGMVLWARHHPARLELVLGSGSGDADPFVRIRQRVLAMGLPPDGDDAAFAWAHLVGLCALVVRRALPGGTDDPRAVRDLCRRMVAVLGR